ncbi:hypothetical protein A2716_03675 [candidate division WWE3 bacterium RIFCSPHIGHO2_01_FULL_40_23]|uniref:DUF4015 domain-containing protein n=1 Tax=candidate division WWE3 bacterium RIFCSPLOWO2_01_FULL_41_18 TaxID=1802625 RepID=A0A1F4VDE8_UNCKA|nr:MAG: hypothetical protein A2716_03675 [candidate division WWE3 bacterium RIFCSPHIGHO2_01_FULL_40_23]OGC54978.1 MAG: hypothetical protein A3A78_03285 [candidate division WWE3 bacterium RIFCSPLOWO2_01_FULL_41_18]
MEKSSQILNSDPAFLRLLDELCLSSVIVDEKNLDETFISSVLRVNDGLNIDVSVEVFSGGELLSEFPSAAPLEAEGRDCSKDWYYGVCPNNEDVRRSKLERIKELSLNKNIRSIILSSLHYPTYWIPSEPIIFDTCYCEVCINKFREGYLNNEKLPESRKELVEAIDGQFYLEWLEFKTKTITSFVESASEVISGISSVKLGAFIIPWTDKEYGSAITRILGQNAFELSSKLDFICPMLYFKLNEKDLSFVDEMLEYYSSCVLYPSILTSKELDSMGILELQSLLSLLSKKDLMGLSIADSSQVFNNEEKLKVLKEAFCEIL